MEEAFWYWRRSPSTASGYRGVSVADCLVVRVQ
jgi:hypothetical protein